MGDVWKYHKHESKLRMKNQLRKKLVEFAMTCDFA